MMMSERGYEHLAKRLRYIANSPYVQKYGHFDHPREMRQAAAMLIAQAIEIDDLKMQTLQENVRAYAAESVMQIAEEGCPVFRGMGGRTMKRQTRLHSAIESFVNVAFGYGVAVLAQVIVFPWFGINIPLSQNLLIGAIFTVVSIARSYALRRAFNWWTIRGSEQ